MNMPMHMHMQVKFCLFPAFINVTFYNSHLSAFKQVLKSSCPEKKSWWKCKMQLVQCLILKETTAERMLNKTLLTKSEHDCESRLFSSLNMNIYFKLYTVF